MLSILLSQTAMANGLLLRFGPPGVGRGGPNPVNLPPSFLDTELGYVTDQGFQTSVSVTGLLLGQRATAKWGGYVAIGGGLILSAQGGGPGVFSEFGVDFRCGLFCWSAAYTQALGIVGSGITSPYAVRIGVSTWFR